MSSTVLSESKFDVYRTVTEQIIAAIESGAGICTMPWHAGLVPVTMPINAATDAQYRGVNVIALWAASVIKCYSAGYWASYKQWQGLGAQVRKGEQGSIIVFYKELQHEDAPADEGRPRFVARATRVFNVRQVDGWQPPPPKVVSEIEFHDQIEAFVKATKAEVRHGAQGARYRRNDDCIEIPSPQQFVGTPTSSPTEAYYAVLLHELTHNAERPVMPYAAVVA